MFWRSKTLKFDYPQFYFLLKRKLNQADNRPQTTNHGSRAVHGPQPTFLNFKRCVLELMLKSYFEKWMNLRFWLFCKSYLWTTKDLLKLIPLRLGAFASKKRRSPRPPLGQNSYQKKLACHKLGVKKKLIPLRPAFRRLGAFAPLCLCEKKKVSLS